jgi:hypothetical protein
MRFHHLFITAHDKWIGGVSWVHSGDREGGGIIATISDDCRSQPSKFFLRTAFSFVFSVALWSLPPPQVPGSGQLHEGLVDMQPLCRCTTLKKPLALPTKFIKLQVT